MGVKQSIVMGVKQSTVVAVKQSTVMGVKQSTVVAVKQSVGTPLPVTFIYQSLNEAHFRSVREIARNDCQLRECLSVSA